MLFMMKQWLICTVSLALMSLGGCGTGSESNTPTSTSQDSTPSNAETDPSPIEESPQNAADGIDSTRLISQEGIGVAQLGMSFGELKAALPEDVDYIVESPFIVDFDAIAVRQEGDVQFYLLYLAGESFTDENIIQGVMTTNPDYQTAEGIGVGVLIREAEAVYGDATLSYNLANESREYVRFENHPAGNLAFGLYGGGAGTTDYAGIYATSTIEYNETQDYAENATIQTILVVCVAEACT